VKKLGKIRNLNTFFKYQSSKYLSSVDIIWR